MDSYDVIVIGGGLEGIAHALRAARGGVRVALFEARAEFGGRLGQVEPFATGEAVPFAHLVWGVDPAAFRFLGLRPQELGLVPAPHLTVIEGEEAPFTLSADPALLRTALGARQPFEIERLGALRATLARCHAAKVTMRDIALETPRRRGARAEDDALAWVSAIGRLSTEQQRDLMTLAVRPISDYLSDFLTDGLLARAVGAPALFASPLSPNAPGSALGLLDAPPLMPALGERLAMPLMTSSDFGGLHRILMTQLHNRGVNFEIGCKVVELHVEKGKATAIGLADGRSIAAGRIISTLDAKATLLGLVDWKELPGTLARRAGDIGLKGSLARLFLKVGDTPPSGVRDLFKGPVYFNMDAAAAAADAWSLSQVPNRPPFEVTVRVTRGAMQQSYIAAFAQFVPHTPHTGEWSEGEATALLRTLTHELEKVWPGVSEKIEDWAMWTPNDLETQFGWSHGAVTAVSPGSTGLISDIGLPEFGGDRAPIEALSLTRPSQSSARSGMVPS